MPENLFIYVLSLRADLRDLSRWGPAEGQAAAAHLAFLQEHAATGKVLIAGRSDQIDEAGHLHPSVMGICIFRDGSLEAAERFAASDPAVTSGLMTARIQKYNLAVHAAPDVWAALH